MARNIKKEIERRWYLRTLRAAAMPRRWSKVWRIRQAYLETRPSTQSIRVRIITNGHRRASMAVKSGKGMVRGEVDRPIAMDLAVALLVSCKHQLDKTRRFIGPWEYDRFHGPLAGVEFLEREFGSRTDAKNIELPPWVGQAVDVTDILSSRDMAKLSAKLALSGGNARAAVERIIARKLQRRKP